MQARFTTASESSPSGGLALLDWVVLIAMAVTAVALAAGLNLQAGLSWLAAIIAAAAFYLVMAASYLAIARTPRGTDSDRLSQLEGVLDIIDSDLQRIDRVENDIARLGQAVTDLPGGHTRIEELAAELENVHARIEDLRTDLQLETRGQREKITKDLGLLEGLIKQLSSELTAGGASAASGAAAAAAVSALNVSEAEPEEDGSRKAEPEDTFVQAASSGEGLSEEEIESVIEAVADILDGGEGAANDESDTVSSETVLTETVLTETVLTETVLTVTETVETGGGDLAAPAIAELTEATAEEAGALVTVQQAIAAGRVDLYLQPIVALPGRKVRYYEGLTRVRDADDEIVLPGAYLAEAARAGILPLLDNVLLVKSVQVLRRLDPESRIKGVFCNLSAQSLLDPDYFPELVEFLEENSGLGESLIFELRQPEIMELTRGELGALDTLGALGFTFSLNHIVDLDIDYIGLNDRYFRFIKLDAATFLNGLEEKGAPLPPADMVRYLESFGLQLIVDRVESEAAVGRLIDAGAELAQGNVFAEPKPVTPALFAELEGAGAA